MKMYLNFFRQWKLFNSPNNSDGTNSSRSTLTRVFALLVPSILIAHPTSAEVLSFVCVFDRYCDDSVECGSSNLELDFKLDTLSGDAFVQGNTGLSPVAAYVGERGVTFSEKLASGAIQSTTATFAGPAVHSRHSIIGGTLSPSQYFGSCDVAEN